MPSGARTAWASFWDFCAAQENPAMLAKQIKENSSTNCTKKQ